MDPKLKAFLATLGITGQRTLLHDDKGVEFIPGDIKGAALLDSFKLSPQEYLSLCKAHGMEPDEDPADLVAELSAADRATRKAAHLEKLTGAGKAKQVMHQERIKTFRASDESVDRAGDIVRVDGWDTRDFQKNPVFLDSHNYSKAPIGRVIKTWIETQDAGAPGGKSLMAHVYFPTKDVSEAADAAYRGVEGKLLGAVSVGFRPTSINNPSTDEDRTALGLGKYGVEFLKQKLWELSLVTVPANQNALVVNSAEQADICKALGVPFELKGSTVCRTCAAAVAQCDDCSKSGGAGCAACSACGMGDKSADRALTLADLAPILDEIKALRTEFKSLAAHVGGFKDSLEAIEQACIDIITRTIPPKAAEGGAGASQTAPNAPASGAEDFAKVLESIKSLNVKPAA